MMDNYVMVKQLADEKRQELKSEFALGRAVKNAENNKPSKKRGLTRSVRNLFSQLLP
jgi:hypothetical protein